MNEFVASNGAKVSLDDKGRVVTAFWTTNYVDTQALREFFQAEADERLGRWRWPENPDYVVYPVGDDTVDVLRESSVSEKTRGPGRQESITRADAAAWDSDAARNFFRAARAYFDAHPEPKPWHDAKPGEVWELTLEGEEPAAFYPSNSMDGCFTPVMPSTGTTAVKFDWPLIVAGRRIWPEVQS